MKKLSLKKMIWSITILRGILIAMLLLCLLPWNDLGLAVVRVTADAMFVFVAAIEFWLVTKIQQERVENPDERDVALMDRAADKAILYNAVILAFLVISITVIWEVTNTIPTMGYIFGFIGVNLPFFIKYCLYLHYERTDEGEYYE